jgi:hypothetical protein
MPQLLSCFCMKDISTLNFRKLHASLIFETPEDTDVSHAVILVGGTQQHALTGLHQMSSPAFLLKASDHHRVMDQASNASRN